MITVIYISSNREDAVFEDKIVNSLKETVKNIPIISVTHKPMEGFTKNICVGDVGLSSYNCRKQFLIGAKEAKTKYVCSAESDFLYPPEYFAYDKGQSISYLTNIYVLYHNRRMFVAKQFSDGAIIANREYVINVLEHMLDGGPEWQNGDAIRSYSLKPFVTHKFRNIIPALTFKTTKGMHMKTNLRKNSSVSDLPYWGMFSEVKHRFLNGR